ncbi:hypothetical protein RhiirA1_465188, partial [Rhizophagus irregularis]
TIWVAKIKDSTQIIGGYNPLDWDEVSYWKTTGDSFIFNFTDGKNISTSKVSYVNNRKYAVFCHDTYGPTMGNLHCYLNDIIRVERELYRFIPLIRFYDIEPTDFFYKVYCYKDVLPQDLIHGLLEYHMVPDIKSKVNLSPSRKPNLKYPLDSTLIKSNHFPLLVSWIDKKYSSHYRKNVPYDFKLLYRSSQDGVDTLSFHKNCDNKGATIWVAKIKNSTQIIGGYNPLDWNVGYVNKQGTAVFCHGNFGPTMGNLHCYLNAWSNFDRNGDRYPNIGIPENNFEVEYYEVFQVLIKNKFFEKLWLSGPLKFQDEMDRIAPWNFQNEVDAKYAEEEEF